MNFICFNKTIATEPFAKTSIEVNVKSGFSTINQKLTLTALKVLVGNERIQKGSLVYVPADAFKHQWAKMVYKLDDMEFILMPEDFVLLIKLPVPRELPTSVSTSLNKDALYY